MKKQQELEAKIRSLLPELQELSFGCEVNFCSKKMIFVGEKWGNYWAIDEKGEQRELRKAALSKIIGHDITLEHVLKVLGVITGEYTAGNQSLSFMWAGEPYGSCIEFDYWDRENGEVLACWQLCKPLSDQSQEVIEFLYPIICTA